MSTIEAKQIVKNYAKFLKRKKFPFSSIFLFGSYAKGNARPWSDIDICVVSNKFKNKNWDKYERQLWYWRRQVDARIEPVGMSPDEFSNSSPLVYEIKKTGIRVE